VRGGAGKRIFGEQGEACKPPSDAEAGDPLGPVVEGPGNTETH
jgi:hypothetical protein